MSDQPELRVSSVSMRNKSVAEENVTSVLDGGVIPVYSHELDADERILAALGYKPEFKREFSLWTTFCVSFAVLGLLPSFAATLYYVSLEIRDMAWTSLTRAPVGNGICWYTGNGMGMANCDDFYSVRCDEYGRALFVNANKWRIVLCCCCEPTQSFAPSRITDF